MRTTSTQRLALESAVVTGAVVAGLDVTVTPDVERLAGCYRITEVSTARPVQEKAAVDARARRTQAAAPSAAPAPTAGTQADFSGRGFAGLIRLDTTRGASGFNVVRVPSDSAIGSWRVVGDAARLDFGSRGLVALSPSQKVPCP